MGSPHAAQVFDKGLREGISNAGVQGRSMAARMARRTGEFKWRGRLIYLSAVLAKEPIGLVACDDDCWEVRYSFHLLGVLDECRHRIVPAQKWHQRESTV